MKVLIIEDESAAFDHLVRLLKKVDPSIQIMGPLESVLAAIEWLKTNPPPDLIFQDIHLSDEISFRIFDQIEVITPIIFTTGHDEYAIQAFDHNSVAYLLKPVQKEALQNALDKFRRLELGKSDFQSLVQNWNPRQQSFQRRFMVTAGDRIKSVNTSDVAYFFGKDKYVYLITHDNDRFLIDHTLTQLETLLDPDSFFRINRQYFISIEAIDEMITYSRSRVKISLQPASKEQVIVSGDKSSDFKKWLNR